MPFQPLEHVPLASFTTLELGGPARYFAEPVAEKDVVAALEFAAARELPTLVLGGGSNLVVADAGFPGLVLRPCMRGKKSLGLDRLRVAAGVAFDDVVDAATARGLSGIECLAGIPGSMGAAPVQNIGAYGQEIGDVIEEVRAVDRRTMATVSLTRAECAFAYRDSLFKREPDRYLILDVLLRLSMDHPAPIRNEELCRSLTEGARPAEIRETVLRVRGTKGMVYDPDDPLRRTVGSFFMNPVVDGKQATWIVATALTRGCVPAADAVPRYPQPDGRVKFPAAWLIEAAGLSKGFRMGPVGISPRHALALVNHGGATTTDLVNLARHIQRVVLDVFGVRLTPEPVFVGIDGENPLA